MEQYQPGVCNIGPEEIARRRRAGNVGSIITLALLVILIAINAPKPLRLLIFIPTMASAVGFLQAYFHFCAAFGLKGVYNLVNPVGNTETVTVAEFRTKDKQIAIQIIAYSTLIGLAIALFAYFLPF